MAGGQGSKKNNLNSRQELFVKEILLDHNATQAAIRAGYSPQTAKAQASRLLTNVNIQRAVAAAKKSLALKLDRQAQDILADIRSITKAAAAKEDFRTALKGLELEGRHLGLFVEKVQHSGLATVVIREERPDD